jgi:hypothetical protein
MDGIMGEVLVDTSVIISERLRRKRLFLQNWRIITL